jgi:predicted lipoprotein
MELREIGRWPVRCLALAVGVCAASPVASAHHAHQVFYDWCRSVSFEGRITRVEWKAPHSVIDVQTDDDTTYHVELTSAQLLARQYNGAPPTALTVGARVAVIAHPARDGAAIRASVPDVKWDAVPNTVDPQQIRRVDNTFNWGAPSPPTPVSCGQK